MTSRPTLAVAWLLANIALLGFLPASDNRYLVGTLASFTALAVLGLQDVTGRFAPARRAPAIALLGLLAAGQVTYNAYLAVHFRGFWGSQFIAASRLVDFVEGRFEGAVVVYPYWRELLYAPEPRNRYVLFREAELTAAGATLQPTESGTVLSFEGSPSIVFLASMVPDPSLPTVTRLPGQTDSLFDRWASWTDLRPRTMLESPYLGEPVAFPTTYHLYDLSSTPSM